MKKLLVLAIVVAATVGVGSVTAFAATMGIGSWHIGTGSNTLTKGTCTVTGSTAIADAYVQEASPNANAANGTTAIVRSSTTGSREWMFVRFDLSTCALPTTGGADTATMKLVVKTTPAAARTLTVTPTLSTWAETLTLDAGAVGHLRRRRNDDLLDRDDERRDAERSRHDRHRRADQELDGELRLADLGRRRVLHEHDDLQHGRGRERRAPPAAGDQL